MRLDGRRTSDNVDDRRGKSSSGKISLGIGGTIIIGLIIWLTGGNPIEFMTQQAVNGVSPKSTYIPSAQEESTATFAKTILASTEDVWTEIFAKNGLKYIAPKMVLSVKLQTQAAEVQHLQPVRSTVLQIKRYTLICLSFKRWKLN